MTDESEPRITRAEKIVLTVWVIMLTIGSAMAMAKHYEIRRVKSVKEVGR